MTRFFQALSAALILAVAGLGIAAEDKADTPADGPSGEATARKSDPEAAALLQSIRSLMSPPRRGNPDTVAKRYRENLKKALDLVARIEKEYPEAAEVHEAQATGVAAAVNYVRADGDKKFLDKAVGLRKRLLASDAGHQEKIAADAWGTLAMLMKQKSTTRPSRRTRELIMGLANRYSDTKMAGDVVAIAAQLAEQQEAEAVQTELEDRLIAKYPEHPRAVELAMMRKPFTATLTRLDGSKLTLPKDLKGEVVVVDFWATWCGPCLAEIPHMKEVYGKYKDKGVEFVGISLDRPNKKAHLAEFVEDRGMDWIHTYSGKAWQDPTARKYGIRGIPSIWVLGRDGKIVSTNARGNLAETIEKALKKEPAEKPKTETSAK
jgi:thiol-disulfide isomerase/thioredoxin